MNSTLIFSSSPNEQTWVSAKNQEQTILQIYSQFFPETQSILLPEYLSLNNSRKLDRFFKKSYDNYIFTGIRPHPASVFLNRKLNKHSRYYFHIYGNFFGELKKWLHLEEQLLDKKVVFLCASERQKTLVSCFMNDPQCIHSIPMPVASLSWCFDAQARKVFRDQENIEEDDFVFVYSGRLSLQKNIGLLIEEISRLASRFPHRKLYLFCAGDFDDMSAPYINIEMPEGYLFSHWNSILETFSISNLKIKYLGHLNSEKRKALYSAGDALVSLSLHHAEAFGVAPLEALLCGLPCLLTDWGGYSSFHFKNSDLCQTIPTTVNAQGCFIHRQALTKSLEYFLLKNRIQEERNTKSQIYHQYFSKENSLKAFSDLEKKDLAPFKGFRAEALTAVEQLYKGFGPKPYPQQYIDLFQSYSGERHD